MSESDKTERLSGLIDSIQFRPGPELSRDLTARSSSSELSPALVNKRDLGRYYAALQAELGTIDLTTAEASLICDALNGILVEEHSVALLWADIDDAVRLDGLAEKWHVDGPALVAKLRGLTYAQSLAVADAVERFWLRPSPNEGPDLTTQLARVGLIGPGTPAKTTTE